MRDELKSKFDALFPTWTTLLATLIALAIILGVLTYFFYKPLRKKINERRQFIQKNIDESQKLNHDAAKKLEEIDKKIIAAQTEASQIITNSKDQAIIIKEKTLQQTNKEVEHILANAQEEIKLNKLKFAQESKNLIVNTALLAAQKILEKEVDNKTNRKIIDKFIEENK